MRGDGAERAGRKDRHDPRRHLQTGRPAFGKALATRTASDEDRRYQALALTAKGRALVPKLAALADRNDAEFFGHLTAAEQETIKAAMRAIVDRHGLKSVPVE